MAEDQEQLVIRVGDLRRMLEASQPRAFMLGDSFTPENIVEIAKSQFPRLEAKVAMHEQMHQTKRMLHQQLEQTKRLLIIVAGLCLIAGAALVVFAPSGKEGVSYVVAVGLVVLSLGAVGIQEFRIRTIGVRIDAGERSLRHNDESE